MARAADPPHRDTARITKSIPRVEVRSVEVIRRFRPIGFFGEIPVVLTLLLVSEDVIQMRQAGEDDLLVVHMFQAALEKLEKDIDRRYVEIGVVTITGIKVWIWNTRTRLCGLAIVLDSELKIVVGRIRDFKYAREPHIDVVRNAREFLGEFFSKEAEFVRSERMVPEQESIQFDILDALTDSLLERVEEFIEVSGVCEFRTYFFGCVARHERCPVRQGARESRNSVRIENKVRNDCVKGKKQGISRILQNYAEHVSGVGRIVSRVSRA